jgi:plasmid replication initiation protein
MHKLVQRNESLAKITTKEQNLKLLKTYGRNTQGTIYKGAYFAKKENCFQSNIVTLSYQEFSLLERKVWLFCINQIERDPIVSNLNQVFEIPVRELNCNYSRLQQLCDTITSKKIHSQAKDGFGVIVPFPEARYYKRKGVAYICLTMLSTVIPYFIDLQKAYTKFNLNIVLRLKTVYAQRIFEIIMMEINGRKKNVFNYELIELQKIIGCNYPNYADFKRRVLEPAKMELSEKAGYDMEYYEVGKQGRKVSELQFMLLPKDRLNIDRIKDEIYGYSIQDEKGIIATCQNQLDNYDFGKRQRKRIMSDMMLIRKFMLIHTRIVEGEIQIKVDATAYIAQSLGFGENRGFLRNRK